MIITNVFRDLTAHIDMLLRLDCENQNVAVSDHVAVVVRHIDPESFSEKSPALFRRIGRDHSISEENGVSQDPVDDSLGRVPRTNNTDFILRGHVLSVLVYVVSTNSTDEHKNSLEPHGTIGTGRARVTPVMRALLPCLRNLSTCSR